MLFRFKNVTLCDLHRRSTDAGPSSAGDVVVGHRDGGVAAAAAVVGRRHVPGRRARRRRRRRRWGGEDAAVAAARRDDDPAVAVSRRDVALVLRRCRQPADSATGLAGLSLTHCPFAAGLIKTQLLSLIHI